MKIPTSLQNAIKRRRGLLRYHLRQTRGPLGRMYWFGRLDELKKLRRECKKHGE